MCRMLARSVVVAFISSAENDPPCNMMCNGTYVFICTVLIDTVSSSECIALSQRMNGEQRTGKDMEGNGCDVIWGAEEVHKSCQSGYLISSWCYYPRISQTENECCHHSTVSYAWSWPALRAVQYWVTYIRVSVMHCCMLGSCSSVLGCDIVCLGEYFPTFWGDGLEVHYEKTSHLTWLSDVMCYNQVNAVFMFEFCFISNWDVRLIFLTHVNDTAVLWYILMCLFNTTV